MNELKDLHEALLMTAAHNPLATIQEFVNYAKEFEAATLALNVREKYEEECG